MAELRYDYDEAETIYLDTLKNYVQYSMVEMTGENEFMLNPGELPSEAPFQNPSAWYPATEISPNESTDPADTLFLLGVRLEPLPENGEEVEVPVALVLLTLDLARIWERIALFYERMDRLGEAYDACRMVLFMYDYMEIDTGIASILEAMRRMAPQFSDEEAQVIIEEQERELDRARVNNHRILEITILQNLAQSYLERGRIREAKDFYQALSEHARELQFTRLSQQAEYGLARADLLNDDLNSSVDRLIELLEQDKLDLGLYADIMALLSRIEFTRGNRPAAVQYALQAHKTYLLLQSPYQSLDMEQLLASIALDGRDYEYAVQQLESARERAQALGIPSVLADVLSDLANAYLSAGLESEALDAADQAYQVACKITLSTPAAETLTTVGRILAELRKFELAPEAYHQALVVYDSIGNRYGQIRVHTGLAWMYYLMDQPEMQIQEARKAWELAQDLKDPIFSRSLRMGLANALSDNELHEEAISHFEAILSEAPNDAITLVNFGWVLFQAGQYDRSLEKSQRALDVDESQEMAIRNLGHAYLAKRMPDQAEREYRRAIRDRKGGEHFYETIRVIKKLLAEKPNLPRGEELLALFETEQARLDAEKDVEKEQDES
jgi:tetratricopeptide (TPR) repeat protein